MKFKKGQHPNLKTEFKKGLIPWNKRIIIITLTLFFISTTAIAKTPWSSKPPVGSTIDYSHPLAKGIVGAWIFNEGGGLRVKDLARSNNGIFNNLISWVVTQKGYALNYSTNGYLNCGSDPSLSFSNNFTISALIYTISYHSLGYFGLFNDFIARGPASTYNYCVGVKTSTVIQFVKRTGAENLQFYNFTVPSMTARWVLVTLTVKNGTLSLYLNGQFSSSQAVGTIAGVAGDILYIGESVPGQEETRFPGNIAGVYIHSRALSPSEIQQLYQDPYCFIKPQTDWNCLKAAVTGVINDVFGWMDGNATSDIFGTVN